MSEGRPRRPRTPAPSELPVPERREKAFAVALRLLGVRERSALEIRQRLAQKGYDPETIVAVLQRLQDHGLQDDRRFAEDFAGSSVRSKGLASRVIQGELRRRGIDKETAAQAAVRTPEEEFATAKAIAQRKASQLGRYPPEVRARRVAGLLARRGYPSEVVSTVLGEILHGERET